MLQSIKNKLLELGPQSAILQGALSLHCRSRGFHVKFEDQSIRLTRGDCEMILTESQVKEVPIMMECFDVFFQGFVPDRRGTNSVLDFSKPGFHTYRNEGVGFYFPSIGEEESIGAYTYWYTPGPGDIVFDAGAHAGATSYFFAKMVGPSGKVFAFEPDDNNYHYLLKNIEYHKLTNVIPVKMALAGSTGTLLFNMDGTMSAGLADYLVYTDKSSQKPVEAMTLADACASLGAVPRFVKMDIEGAEVTVIDSSRDFLKTHGVHFAIESYHRVNEELTYKALDRIFPQIDYRVESSDRFKQMFTWAKPPENTV